MVTASTYADRMREDIKYLGEFKLVDSKSNNGVRAWRFEFSTQNNGYMIDCHIINYQTGEWKAKIDVHWRVRTKDITDGAGKDFTRVFGPYGGYQEMVNELNRILNNNPLFSTSNYHDDYELNMAKEVFVLLIKLKEKIGEVKELNTPMLSSLERIYDAMKDVPDNELMKFIQKLAPTFLEKTTMILELQKLDRIPYYRSIRAMHS